VLDVAKVARGLVAAPDVRAAVTEGRVPKAIGIPLVAVPTTAGTGSEATHFAALYVDGVKHSVGHVSFRPDYVLLDPALSSSMPPRLTAETGLDALSQAIESMWSSRSTDQSLAYARAALELAWGNLEGAVRAPTQANRAAMCTAANLAGRAIDISKTTAAHALSYSITVRHGVAHGHAVALSLGALIEFNSEIADHDCMDPRGTAFVRARIGEVLAAMGVSDGTSGRRSFSDLVRRLGLETSLSLVGAGAPAARAEIVDSVDAKRLANNPRALGPESLQALVDGIA
jgi:alcohol dehydrogenase class IV